MFNYNHFTKSALHALETLGWIRRHGHAWKITKAGHRLGFGVN